VVEVVHSLVRSTVQLGRLLGDTPAVLGGGFPKRW
jgi:hypothetical protein